MNYADFIATAWNDHADDADAVARRLAEPQAQPPTAADMVPFARIVTHYWRHGCWVEGLDLVGGASQLAAIPALLVHGGLDISSPPDVAWRLSQSWPGARLTLIDNAGHGAGEPGMTEILVQATDLFAG